LAFCVRLSVQTGGNLSEALIRIGESFRQQIALEAKAAALTAQGRLQALIMLAMQAAGSTNPADYAQHVMSVANAPGEKILPGELGRALELLAAGQEIDYVGASAVELVGPGESGGAYREIEIRGGQIETVRFR
jgi:hypothetical protein